MIGRIVTELQSLGLRYEGPVLKRSGGAGPAEGGSLLLNGKAVCVPYSGPYVAESPFCLKEEGGQVLLFKGEQSVGPVVLIKRPRFYDLTTSENIPYPKIALLHGQDCLASTIMQTCANWRDAQPCRFCGIELSLMNQQTIARKAPQQLAEVAQRAKELDFIRQVVLTTGRAAHSGEEIDHLARCAKAVKKSTGLPIQAQFLPPPGLDGFDRLKEAGVDSVGIHVESFDFDVLSKVAPGKAKMGHGEYVRAWKKAVELFGSNQVSSFLIVGLGESEESVVMGAEFLADLGVYPFIVPFRPIPGSMMEAVRPPDPQKMVRIYKAVAELLKRKGLTMFRQKAGCVRCGACSAMGFFEQRNNGLICHPVRCRKELVQALEIRNQVFVREQNLFDQSDADPNDDKSIHLVAELEDQIIGTVRVFPNENKGHWVGGRLAIKRNTAILAPGNSWSGRRWAMSRNKSATGSPPTSKKKTCPSSPASAGKPLDPSLNTTVNPTSSWKRTWRIMSRLPPLSSPIKGEEVNLVPSPLSLQLTFT